MNAAKAYIAVREIVKGTVHTSRRPAHELKELLEVLGEQQGFNVAPTTIIFKAVVPPSTFVDTDQDLGGVAAQF
jgi:hypothetical protein